ncbi:MAG: hypothetical protein ACHQT9_04745 [Candidatus Saccharimonadales bacterium]
MFSKPNSIVYLRHNDIIVGGKKIDPGRLALPSESFIHLEVQNPELFASTCADFFRSQGLKGKKVLIVLDDSVVFSKVVQLDNENRANIAGILTGYVDEMPINEGYRSVLGYQVKDALYIYGTNAMLYEALEDALNRSGVSKVIAVTPSEAYDIDFTAQSAEIISNLLMDKTVRNKINFSTVSPN